MGASLNVEDGSYNLDTGNYLGPAADGWLVDLYPKPPMKLGEYAFMSVGLHFGPLGHNFSLVTELDNVYDGVEARRAVGKDRNGRHIEEKMKTTVI